MDVLTDPHVSQIARVIELAIAPVFLLTAVGTLLAVLTNRLGRSVDRRRDLEERVGTMTLAESERASVELDLVARRIRLIYFAISLAVLCALLICLLIVTAFAGAFVAADLSRVLASMFVLGMIALIGSLLAFLREIFLAIVTPRQVIAVPTATGAKEEGGSVVQR